MKKLLFILLLSLSMSLSAQVETINIDWGFNSTPSAAGDANASRTIEIGDTVIWNWYSSGSHNVVRQAGSSSDSFSNGPGTFPQGTTFSHTFTSLGTNDYVCTPHAGIMFGTITVVAEGTLSTPTFEAPSKFSIYPNPSSDVMNVSIPTIGDKGLNLEVFDILGKKVYTQQLTDLSSNINITGWNSGLYLVRISSPGQEITLTKRFVKL